MDDSLTIGGTVISSELRMILRETGVGIWCYDGSTRRFTMDDTCRELFDIARDHPVTQASLQERIHPDDRDRYQAAVRRVTDGDSEISIDYRIVRRDGTVRFISGRGRVKPHLRDDPAVINGVCIDVSERRELEAQLHATELRMQQLADSFPGLFSYIDCDYIIRFMSNRYLEHIGRDREPVINRHLSSIAGEKRFLARKPLYDRALGGESLTFEEERALAGGGQRYYTITYHPDREPGGRVRGFMTIGLDITELREMERALRERTTELSRSNHDLEQFAYVASHDLKAPLRAIEVLVEWLREDLAGYDKGEVQENLSLLGQRCTRLNRLLDDLLAYSRAGREKSTAVLVDTRQLVLDIVALLAPPASMCIEAAENLPVISTVRSPLEQVLRNLINNAIKHHPTQNGRITVAAEKHGADLVFTVEDDGAGIPLEFSDKVFQMFQTLKPRDEVEGSGMGLAIVKRLVEAQGGRIWFRPGRDGRGTIFKFTWKPLAGKAAASGNHERVLRLHSAG